MRPKSIGMVLHIGQPWLVIRSTAHHRHYYPPPPPPPLFNMQTQSVVEWLPDQLFILDCLRVMCGVQLWYEVSFCESGVQSTSSIKTFFAWCNLMLCWLWWHQPENGRDPPELHHAFIFAWLVYHARLQFYSLLKHQQVKHDEPS